MPILETLGAAATLLPIVKGFLAQFIPDPEARAKAESEVTNALQRWDQGQLEINKAEAESPSLFKGGWRPFIGWTCGGAFAYHYILQPMTSDFLALFGWALGKTQLDMATIMGLLTAMLGIGGMRTWERLKGVERP